MSDTNALFGKQVIAFNHPETIPHDKPVLALLCDDRDVEFWAVIEYSINLRGICHRGKCNREYVLVNEFEGTCERYCICYNKTVGWIDIESLPKHPQPPSGDVER